MIFIEGQETKIPLDDLIAKGRELISSGYPQAGRAFSEETSAAITAVHWYDEQHRLYVEKEANGQSHA